MPTVKGSRRNPEMQQTLNKVFLDIDKRFSLPKNSELGLQQNRYPLGLPNMTAIKATDKASPVCC